MIDYIRDVVFDSVKVSAGLLLAFACSCVPFSPPDPPAPPIAPRQPEVVRLPTLTRPQLPEVELGLKVWADSVPEVFPVPKTEVMVISLPQGVALSEGGKDDNSNLLRHALVSGFLRNGYAVKDAGLVAPPTLTMRRYPATETERSETVRTTEVGEDSVTETTKVVRGGENWWWNNNGLVVNLTDPTSLWAPELLQYAALKAPYFFRIFEVESAKSKVGAGSFDPDSTPLQVSDERYAAYVRDVDDYNVSVQNQQRSIEAAEKDWRRAMDQYQSYRESYTAYTKAYATKYSKIIDDANRGLEPSQRYPKKPMAELAEPPVGLPAAPSTIRALTKESILQRGTRGDFDAHYVMILGEVVETETGRVVWAGRILCGGPSTMTHMELVGAALDHMAASSK